MRKHVVRHARRVHHHINRHALYWVAFFVYALVVALQLLYPLDRAVPFARVGSESVGFARYDDIVVKVNEYFVDAQAKVQVDDSRYVVAKVREIGGQMDSDAVARRTVNYPLWSRMIPFSFVAIRPHVVTTPVWFDQTRLDVASSQYAAVLTAPPQNAGLAIAEGQLKMTPDRPGSVVKAEDVTQAIRQAQIGLVYTVITVPHETVRAERSVAFFESVAEQAKQFIDLPITITVSDEVVRPTAEQKASWLSIGERDGTALLEFDQSAVDGYLGEIQSRYTTPAGQTQVSRVDGQEVERVMGDAGETIDVATLKERLQVMLKTGEYQPLEAQFVPVAPTVVINKRYSSTAEGLQAYVDDQASSRNVRISVVQIGGSGWVAGARDAESTVSASTYKLFVALALFDRMDRGEITWETPILDTNTKGCFERMIVASTNACAEEWIRQFGRSGINNFIWSRGFSRATDFNNPEANHTSAADLTRYFRGLHEGWLMSGWAREYLLAALQRHSYKRGIPAGSAGSVHNKVGFLWDYSNDSAIVYHPRGTYAIAVLTKGLSFYAIADITREIEALMYP